MIRVSGVSSWKIVFGAVAIPLLQLAIPASAQDVLPRILIFNGMPGDEAHHHFFEKNLGDLRQTLRQMSQ